VPGVALNGVRRLLSVNIGDPQAGSATVTPSATQSHLIT
jgi:hypothetical protein